MPARITLVVRKGEHTVQECVFQERTTCIVGRAKDCELRIPTDKGHRKISRHHCLLDINPPAIRVRDFGSLNGTYVNGRKIGQRQVDQTLTDPTAIQSPECDLHDGDEIQLGDTVIRVVVDVPPECRLCGAELCETERAASAEGLANGVLCEACRSKAGPETPTKTFQPGPPQPPPLGSTFERARLCVKCRRDVTGETGTSWQGEYLCDNCRTDPLELVKLLLREASTGVSSLSAIEGYELLRELGRGGMGAVYVARHQKTGRQVAIKLMLPKVAASPRGVERFLREVENTKALQHPNVVRLYDSGHWLGAFFFTMEFCQGRSVSHLMQCRGGILSVEEAGPIVLQALDGLDYAHHAEIRHIRLKDGAVTSGRGLVHRDLKPKNLFLSGLSGLWIAKVGDYGLAKAFDLAGFSGHTFTGDVAGSPRFMPRQQILNFRETKPEVDVWAMAASLYSMLTGCVPRDFSADRDVWQTVLQTAPVPIRKRNRAIPARLAQVIDHALVDDPEIGFKSAADFKRALQQVL